MNNALKILLVATLSLGLRHAECQTIKSIDNSLNAGKVLWIPQQINTGKVPFGIPVRREFDVKNISTENLIILQVKSSCHCTVAEWPKEPVAPGQSSHIVVTYDAKVEGDFYRIVTVLTNFDTNQSVPLALIGKVDPKTETPVGQ
jgi:hypothetical protein